MKAIIFDTHDVYNVIDVDMSFDENGIPADIVISSLDKAVLDEIADKHCRLGYNVECRDNGMFEALYGRLDSFRLSANVSTSLVGSY